MQNRNGFNLIENNGLILQATDKFILTTSF